MNKKDQKPQKPRLKKETLRTLTHAELSAINGGAMALESGDSPCCGSGYCVAPGGGG